MSGTKRKGFIFAGLILALVLAVCGIGLVSHSATAAAESTPEDLSFSLINNSTEYKVSALNKQLTEAIIPRTYNGLPVTEVADNAFFACSKLTKVIVPYSVTRIGNNAFYNCAALEKISGMSNVSTIGNNAFALCPNLQNLILSPKITSLGRTIVRNNKHNIYSRLSESKMKTLNANWDTGRSSESRIIYGNDLACTRIEGDTIGYSIDSYQSLLCAEEDLILKCSYTDFNESNEEVIYPITEISEQAFECNEFKSLTLQYDERIPSDFTVNIKTGAFMATQTDAINIEVNISLIDVGSVSEENASPLEYDTSIDLFTGSFIKVVTLPDSIDTITRNMFALCEHLETIKNTNANVLDNHLSSKIKNICSGAFTDCKKLSEIYIPNSVENVLETVFDQWGKSEVVQTIYIDKYHADDTWKENWVGSIGSNLKIEFNSVIANFDFQGGTGGTQSVRLLPNQPMPEAIAPTRTGYTFLGYWRTPQPDSLLDYDEEGQYYDSHMTSIRDWEGDEDSITLYAYWRANTYFIDYYPNKPAEAKGEVTGATKTSRHTYDDNSRPLTPNGFSLEGWYFKGWKDEKGVTYSDRQSVFNLAKGDGVTVKFYAQWERRHGTFTCDTGFATNSVSVYSDDDDLSNMNFDLPDANYRFDGWYYDEIYTKPIVNTPMGLLDNSGRKLYAKVSVVNASMYFNIPKDCYRLYINSNNGNASNMHISLAAFRTTKLTLILEDLIINGGSSSDDVLSLTNTDADIYVKGTVNINAGDGTFIAKTVVPGASAIAGRDLNITILDNAKLYLYGATGNNSQAGGGKGGNAIKASGYLTLKRMQATESISFSEDNPSVILQGGFGGMSTREIYHGDGGEAVDAKGGLRFDFTHTNFLIQGGEGCSGVNDQIGGSGGNAITSGQLNTDFFSINLGEYCRGTIRGGNAGLSGLGDGYYGSAAFGGIGISHSGDVIFNASGYLTSVYVYGGTAGQSHASRNGGTALLAQSLRVGGKSKIYLFGGKGSYGRTQEECGNGGAPIVLFGENSVDVSLSSLGTLVYYCGAGGTNVNGGAGGAEQRYSEEDRIHYGKNVGVTWFDSTGQYNPYA